jgi:hypothetical protein
MYLAEAVKFADRVGGEHAGYPIEGYGIVLMDVGYE